MGVETVICTIPGCNKGPNGRPWESPKDLQTYSQRSAEVRIHLDMDHYSDFHTSSKEETPKETKESNYT